MDILTLHEQDESEDAAERYDQMLRDFAKKAELDLNPSWLLMLYADDEKQMRTRIREYHKAGIPGRSYLVSDSHTFIKQLNELHMYGVSNFRVYTENKNSDNMLMQHFHADQVFIAYDNVTFASLSEITRDISDDVYANFLGIIILNKMLEEYIAPEIIGRNDQSVYHDDMRYFADKIEQRVEKLKTVAPPQKPHNVFDKADNIIVLGAWELMRHFAVKIPNTIFMYLSLMPYTQTSEMLQRKFPGCEIKSQAVSLYKAHIGYQLKVINKSSSRGKVNNFTVIVTAHQLIIPMITPRATTLLQHLFWASYLFIADNMVYNDAIGPPFYNALMGMARIILRDHLDHPAKLAGVFGPVSASRYAFFRRGITTTRWNSHAEVHSEAIPGEHQEQLIARKYATDEMSDFIPIYIHNESETTIDGGISDRPIIADFVHAMKYFGDSND